MEPGSEGTFPLAWCAACGTEVLPYVELDAGGDEAYRCLHCATLLDGTPRAATAAEVAAAGYAVLDEPACGRCDCLAPGSDDGRNGRRK